MKKTFRTIFIIIVLAVVINRCGKEEKYQENTLPAPTEAAEITKDAQETESSDTGDDTTAPEDKNASGNNEVSESENNTSENADVSEKENASENVDVSVEENSPAADNFEFRLSEVPEYAGNPYIALNNYIPLFTDEEKTTEVFENYSELDEFGRCGVAYANICRELMPTESRGTIGQIKPTGWHTVKYNDLIQGNYLYNRCHLIGYQLAGENANVKNLITGTRYLNMVGMLSFENQVENYVSATGNHVLYRVTPIFEGDNLVASGVTMEAWSVEDNGAGISFYVYLYNVQPGIIIDYATGESEREVPIDAPESEEEPIPTPEPTPTAEPTPEPTATPAPTPTLRPTEPPIILGDYEVSRITLSGDLRYADFAAIGDGAATLYKNTKGAHGDIVVCVNAGHGTRGGSNVKTYCHPDKTEKVTGGTTAAGNTKAIAVSSGMNFSDGTPEHRVNLKVALLLRDRLLNAGYSVLMIREEEDVQLDNVARTVLANNYADCHVAIHFDSTESDKGAFFMSVPNVKSYRNMEPVASTWEKSHAFGQALIDGLKENGTKIFGDGRMAMDLTQTSFSTVPSIDIELGDKKSDHSDSGLAKLADGLLAGIEKYFAQ